MGITSFDHTSPYLSPLPFIRPLHPVHSSFLRILLHWRVSFPEIHLALQARPSSEANGGWVAVAFSRLGYMGASDAIIANLLPQYSPIRTFELHGYEPSDIVETDRFSVGDASVMTESDGSLLVK